MNAALILLKVLVSATSVTITEPVDGEVYDGDWLLLNAVVENGDEPPDSVRYRLNGGDAVSVPRLSTDWFTYMQNDLHHGYSESPAPMDDTVLWTAPVTGTDHEFPTPVVVDGLVYYPQNMGGDTLFALDAATGSVEWVFPGTGSTDDAVTVKDGMLYSASDSIYCLDALSGERIWASGAGDWTGSTPAVVDDMVYCGLAGTPSQIVCLDAADGEVLWSTPVNAHLASCMTAWEGMLLVPTYSYSPEYGSVYAFDRFSGDPVWENDDYPAGYWDSSPVVVDGVLYLGGYVQQNGINGLVRAIDASSGQTLWEKDIESNITATPAYHDGRLYLGGEDSNFVSLDALDGSEYWVRDYRIHGSPAVAEGCVFFGEYTFGGSGVRVIALDCASGDTVWTHAVPANRFQGSPSVTDGVLYIPALDGYLYAFGTGLRYTYREEYFYADVGPNELIVASFDEGCVAAADTISFTVTQEGVLASPSNRLSFSCCPNPFGNSTIVSFDLPEPAATTVTVYDLSGRAVRVICDSRLARGEHSIGWDGSAEDGRPLSAGLYICRIEAGGLQQTTGVCLLR
jgi:outer membrane protein assembly factor BamB